MRLSPSKPQTAGVGFTIRNYRAADFQRLWKIDQLCFPQGIAYTQMEMNGFVMRRNAITLVAERADGGSGPESIVGYTIAQLFRKTGRVITLDILPEARRAGLASRLMQEAEDRLRARGCKEIYLETAVNNEAAIKLYQKLGYEMIDRVPLYYSSHALDAYVMGKAL